MAAVPVISGAVPCGVVDSQLCTQILSMLGTNGTLLSDSKHPRIRILKQLIHYIVEILSM